MSYLYLPYVNRQFKAYTEVVYNSRTSNMTLSIGQRIQGYESMIQANSLKLASVLKDAYNPNSTFPYIQVN